MFKRRIGLGAMAACALIWSCGASKGRSADATSPPSGDEAKDPILNTTVYDETGRAKSCSKPEPKCEKEHRPSVEFQDQCRLNGFRMMKCGCEHVCSGGVAAKDGYNAKNERRQCAPPKPDCEPKDTSAAFQDACTDSGHKFVICGCEWMCAGKLKHPVSETKPPPEEETPPPPKEGEKTDKAAKPGDKTAKPPAPAGKKP